jgi:16S rRNA (cytosine1402-N4)-methyltransferase
MSAVNMQSEVSVSENLISDSVHVPVLLHEIIENLVQGRTSDGHFWYLDGTLGGAGHALAIANAYEKANSKKLSIIGFDRDRQAIERAKKTLEGKADRLILECESFRNLNARIDMHASEIMYANQLPANQSQSSAGQSSVNQSPTMNAILLDLGISSDELENSGRGFSFQKDEPLEMTMGDPAKYPFTAKDIVNGWKEEDIANVIFAYGEERYARRIARAIVAYRAKKKIETTMELAEIVKSAVPRFGRSFGGKPAKIHPATKTFQALRIAVNDELGALREGLAKGYEKLAPGGKMAVISFHSLEDRIVKNYFKARADDSMAKILTKKPITASPQELAENPRSRSAKLRIIEKTVNRQLAE